MPKRRRNRRQSEHEAPRLASPIKDERIPADFSQHAPHNSYGGVPLYYKDKEFVCVDCGKTEVFTAEQQKWWYETDKGYIFSTAIRCQACRTALKDAHGGTARRSHRERREDRDDS